MDKPALLIDFREKHLFEPWRANYEFGERDDRRDFKTIELAVNGDGKGKVKKTIENFLSTQV